jgi:hypothetical protein
MDAAHDCSIITGSAMAIVDGNTMHKQDGARLQRSPYRPVVTHSLLETIIIDRAYRATRYPIVHPLSPTLRAICLSLRHMGA